MDIENKSNSFTFNFKNKTRFQRTKKESGNFWFFLLLSNPLLISLLYWLYNSIPNQDIKFWLFFIVIAFIYIASQIGVVYAYLYKDNFSIGNVIKETFEGLGNIFNGLG